MSVILIMLKDMLLDWWYAITAQIVQLNIVLKI